jgi:hypothetical protein
MLDPWAEEAPTVTSASAAGPQRPAPRAAPPPLPGQAGLDLSSIEALADLPEDARAAFARAAALKTLARDDEVSGFALALVLEGGVDLAATIVDAPAVRLEAGQVLRSRGTIEHVVPVRLVGATDRARVATWDEKAVESAFGTCPWVEDDLRAAADRPQALAGITMGPLGERLDPAMRSDVTAKLRLRTLATHESVVRRGQPVPGLLAVGAGELEIVGEDGASTGRVLRPGDFVFPAEVLSAAPAPHAVRAGQGGALLLVADRAAAQELLMACPPLLELFAGM